jgi:CxxC motif-containing protein
MNTRTFICINCPMGCELSVAYDGGGLRITGHSCALGEAYAREEVTNPTRTIAGSVPIEGGDCAMLSVKTSRPIPKDAIFDCMRAIRAIRASAPVNIGDVLIRDVCGTGVDIVATRGVARA